MDPMDPFALLRWPAFWLRFWLERVGGKALLWMFGGGVVLAVIVNYAT